MSWGSGVFTRIFGSTGWTDDKNAATKILSSRHDTHDQDLSDGINACMTRDNAAKPTASFLANADNTLDLGSGAVRWRAIYPVVILSADGSLTNCAYSFSGDPNTGMNHGGSDDLRLVTAGLTALEITSTQNLWAVNGSAAAPTYAFLNGTGDGLYHDTANQIGVALNGVTAGQIAQGTFTGTFTGMTTVVTGTVTWQRFGRFVLITLPNTASGTSNATSFTMTGVPAIIQPTTLSPVVRLPYFGTNNNGAVVDQADVLINAASGTWTFLLNGSATGWTAANAKGFGANTSFCFLI